MDNIPQEVARAHELFMSGMNCAQAVFCAFAPKYSIEESQAAKISCALGGGVGRMREVCGAVTGAGLALGLRHGEDKAVVYPYMQEFCERFKKECGSIVCRELLRGTSATAGGSPEARTSEYYSKRPCSEIVKLAASILCEMGV